MKVYILDKVLEYNNDKNIIDDILQEINNALERTDYFFSHLIVDGQEVYEDYNGYFLDNIKNIKEVKVVSRTLKELTENIMLSTIDYFNRAIPEINMLSNEFYKTPTQGSWSKLADFLEGIAWIMDTFITIDTNARIGDIVSNYEEWNLYAKNIYALQEQLEQLEEAMKNKDIVLLADILSYEIIPLFKSMKEGLEYSVYKGDN
ncbi:hypothetical protein [Brassicibacter mesophilus]|uniref:hypothetical protein n=1 Tax=Brassicibacter mesophilus TaxID=745119 RepID=UPI003D1EC821